ncbi:hypothetical protein V1524DRAFT_443022 [Lipomyces starkeyi]
MQSTIHQQFDTFKFAVGPDDNYKITCFSSFSIDPYIVLMEGRLTQSAGTQQTNKKL